MLDKGLFSDLTHILAFSLFMFKIKLTVKTCKQEPTMEDKNPWNGYVKTFFHTLYLSNIQM